MVVIRELGELGKHLPGAVSVDCVPVYSSSALLLSHFFSSFRFPSQSNLP